MSNITEEKHNEILINHTYDIIKKIIHFIIVCLFVYFYEDELRKLWNCTMPNIFTNVKTINSTVNLWIPFLILRFIMK